MGACKPYLSALLFLLASFVLSGCASIFSESVYPVSISSSPSGAQIRIMNRHGITVYTGTTPVMVPLSASAGFFEKQEYIIEISKGGETVRTALIADLDGWYLANIALVNLIGLLIIDPATGAMWKFDSTKHVEFRTNDNEMNTDESTLHILEIKEIPEAARSALIPVH